MAITTYSELKAAAAGWLVRSDLTARIPEFIALAEARLNRQVRKRQAEVDAPLTATPSSRSISLPATFSEAVRLWIVRDGQRYEVQYCDPGLMAATDDAGEPKWWGVDGSTLVFERPCDQAYSFVLRHWTKYALSDASPTNTLLSDAPDVYLFATLAEAGPFLRDANLSSAYEAKLTRAINELNAKDNRSKGLQTLRTEVAGMVGRQGRNFNILTGS